VKRKTTRKKLLSENSGHQGSRLLKIEKRPNSVTGAGEAEKKTTVGGGIRDNDTIRKGLKGRVGVKEGKRARGGGT